MFSSFFCYLDPPATALYTLSLHDALPISPRRQVLLEHRAGGGIVVRDEHAQIAQLGGWRRPSREVLAGEACVEPDRKSTRLNSSHTVISYAVFCLKKKTKKKTMCHVINTA